jgi:pimeloyl-ACP methyl ester carboxylesterase
MPWAGTLGPGRDRSFPLPQYLTLVDGLRTAFCDAGRGPAVVLVHGWGGNLTHWGPVARALAAEHRVVGVDLPACGESERPRGPLSVRLLAEQLRGLLDALRIDRAALVGHSLGAMATAELALRHPGRVSRLVLLTPAGFQRAPLWLRTAGRALLRPLVLDALLPPLWKPALERIFAEPSAHTRRFLRTLEESVRGRDVRDAAGAAVELRDELLDRDFLGVLCDAVAPTLVAWGDEDRLTPAGELRGIACRRPGLALREIGRCGLLPYVERPDKVAELIRGHLAPLREAPVEAEGPRGGEADEDSRAPLLPSGAAEAEPPPAVAPPARPAAGRARRLPRRLL